MKKKGLARQFLKIIILLAITIGLLILLIAWVAPKPPTAEFNMYNTLVSTSESIRLYDPESFNNADFFRKQAYNEWQEQNTKFLLKRDFSEVERMILMAISILEEANNIENKAMETTVTNNNSFIDDASFVHQALLNRQKWERWINDAVQYSKCKNAAILIVDKQKHSCFVVESGMLVHDYLIELGVNRLNDKNKRNDYATPEGTYYISGKKEDEASKNNKTLLLNFPNKEDKERFEKAFQQNGMPDLDVLSYKLSIHGNGGKGYDWTDGSIALSNEDMNMLYSKVKIGTKVVIVGTTEGILMIENKEI